VELPRDQRFKVDNIYIPLGPRMLTAISEANNNIGVEKGYETPVSLRLSASSTCNKFWKIS